MNRHQILQVLWFCFETLLFTYNYSTILFAHNRTHSSILLISTTMRVFFFASSLCPFNWSVDIGFSGKYYPHRHHHRRFLQICFIQYAMNFPLLHIMRWKKRFPIIRLIQALQKCKFVDSVAIINYRLHILLPKWFVLMSSTFVFMCLLNFSSHTQLWISFPTWILNPDVCKSKRYCKTDYCVFSSIKNDR